MSPPPRPRRAVLLEPPRQPYPVATDLESNEYDVALDDEVPFDLESDEVPTMRDLSVQIGAVDRRVRVVRREVALTRKELGELRTYVMGDQAPRLTDVAKRVDDVEKRVPLTIPPGVKKGGAVVGIAAIYPLLDWLIPLAQKWIESR